MQVKVPSNLLSVSLTGHLLELKLAAISALSYEDFWLVSNILHYVGRNQELTTSSSLRCSERVNIPISGISSIQNSRLSLLRTHINSGERTTKLSLRHSISEVTVVGRFDWPRWRYGSVDWNRKLITSVMRRRWRSRSESGILNSALSF
jgi:hypothetical protein